MRNVEEVIAFIIDDGNYPGVSPRGRIHDAIDLIGDGSYQIFGIDGGIKPGIITNWIGMEEINPNIELSCVIVNEDDEEIPLILTMSHVTFFDLLLGVE